MAEEEAALAEVMNLLQTEPERGPAGGLVPTAPGPDIPALREQLAVLVSTGKAKEAIGVQLTHEQVKRLSEKKRSRNSPNATRRTWAQRQQRA